jgi:hypothetical protein
MILINIAKAEREVWFILRTDHDPKDIKYVADRALIPEGILLYPSQTLRYI